MTLQKELREWAEDIHTTQGKNPKSDLLISAADRLDELADAFTLLWVTADRSKWDWTAVEHFDAVFDKLEVGK